MKVSSTKNLLRAACAFALLFSGAVYAFDQEVSAEQGDQCARDRFGSNLNCTANDLVATVSATVDTNEIQPCPINTQSTVSLLFTISSGSATRYNLGLFVGDNGNSAITAGGTCSVATFLNNVTPFFDSDGNACGDLNGNASSVVKVDNVKILCVGDSNGNLVVPYGLVYSNSGTACTGPSDVTAQTKSKCNGASASVGNVFVTTAADPSCGEQLSFDPATNTVTAVFTISNTDASYQQAGDGTKFEDDLSGTTLTNLAATCTNSSGGASCPADLSSAGGIVTGTIGTFPYGGSVEITVTANYTPGDQNQVTEGLTLITPPTVLPPTPPYVRDTATGISTFANACTAATQLPIKLQSFDVK